MKRNEKRCVLPIGHALGHIFGTKQDMPLHQCNKPESWNEFQTSKSYNEDEVNAAIRAKLTGKDGF